MYKWSSLSFALLVAGNSVYSQNNSLVNTSNSAHAKLHPVDLNAVTWTTGFWGERMQVCKDSMVPHLWRTYTDANVSHAYKNFEIAAGRDTGSHKGPPFHDGDFYKLLEAVASLYADTKDKRLEVMMDTAIATIAQCQRADGYIHTPVIIAERNSGKTKAFEDRLNFETYNLGHLMTAGCIHYRVTGKRTLLNVAIKAADYLDNFYKRSSPELARNAICPSHYMGVVELYRTTKDVRYLQLAINLINIRGLVDNGTDDNQDRIPFRQQKAAMGHAVRANYLYAGVADVYAETGDDSLMDCLHSIWDDVVYKKMYVTGGCGALYDGVSPYGVSYQPPFIQKTHQAYGRAYQLPNMTAHNETCANIGNLLWNWRMLLLSGDAKYADVMELDLYNAILSGISLDGNNFFYTNPLSASGEFPYTLRWAGGRIPYISLSNCCPPNTVRTMAEVSDYAYTTSEKGIWVHLYGGNTLSTRLKNGAVVQLSQQSNYPWDGHIKFSVTKVGTNPFSLFLRIPGWCKKAGVTVNGKPLAVATKAAQYAEINRSWKAGDVIELDLSMPVTLIESNPLVEETRNQLAVKRGPIVYCLESTDLPKGTNVFDIALPVKNDLKPGITIINKSKIATLQGTGLLQPKTDWSNALYKEARTSATPVKITMIPYYAWGNRGKCDMTVWVRK
ncbi:glycoside hydrolase family 127 protein [Niastella caeni]|uniref:Glycoside hydrolase family 127 protein n=1 Tax=Niastella caeni TaxID=2569763 RepID=A0A4V4H1B2_9BACT|nr:glycoside hydrolase family 127 protein [Niastella caeni]THU39726.1 glycoside hydrolase family 127 protein [Niastella caeni]